jgi:hypothetical protein
MRCPDTASEGGLDSTFGILAKKSYFVDSGFNPGCFCQPRTSPSGSPVLHGKILESFARSFAAS